MIPLFSEYRTDLFMKTLEEILEPIREPLKFVEGQTLKNFSGHIDLLTEIGTYIFQSGGKKIRPALLLLANGIFCPIRESSYLAAGVVEYIHTATLLHDDIVDSAEIRRKRKTVNTVWGNEAAVLVGDFLFATSFRLISQLQDLKIIETLANCTTTMAKGEILQLIQDYSSVDEEHYYSIIRHKTASLMGSCTKIGGIIGGASKEQTEILFLLGSEVGFTFQIIDDALDYRIKNKQGDKKTGNDLKDRKPTLPLIHLLKNSSEREQAEIQEIFEGEEITDVEIEEIYRRMSEKKSIEFSIDCAERHCESALKKIKKFPQNIYSQALEELVRYIVRRDF